MKNKYYNKIQPILSYHRKLFDLFLKVIDNISYGVIVFAMATMTLLIVIEVVMRYVFSSSLGFSDEVSRLLFVWAIFLAIPHGIYYGIHVSIEAIVTHLNATVRHWVWRGMISVTIIFMGILCVSSFKSAVSNWQQLMPTVNLTVSAYYIPLVISAAHSILHLLRLLLHEDEGMLTSGDES